MDEEDEDAGNVVLLHQPVSAAAYRGVDSLDEVDAADPADPSALQTPRDDGIPDVPPGIVNVGHLHDAMPPRIIWNADTDQVTWTVVNQLGTAGGVEENPTFNRFSTPFSTPLKDLSIQLHHVDVETGLPTGYVDRTVSPGGDVILGARTDIGPPVAGRLLTLRQRGGLRGGRGPSHPASRRSSPSCWDMTDTQTARLQAHDSHPTNRELFGGRLVSARSACLDGGTEARPLPRPQAPLSRDNRTSPSRRTVPVMHGAVEHRPDALRAHAA